MTDLITRLSASVAFVALGLALFTFAIVERLSLGGYQIQVGQTWSRIMLAIVGLLLLALGVYLEWVSKHGGRIKESDSAGDVPGGTANSPFFSLDDPAAGSFAARIKDATRVSVLGRTSVNLLNHYEHAIIDRAQSGCQFRLLFISPDCDASKYVYGGRPDVYQSNSKASAERLRALRAKVGTKLQAKTIDYAPTMSVVIIERSNGTAAVQVQLYFLHSRIGRDRPMFRLDSKDKWYHCFLDEFEQLWTAAREWSWDAEGNK